MPPPPFFAPLEDCNKDRDIRGDGYCEKGIAIALLIEAIAVLGAVLGWWLCKLVTDYMRFRGVL